MEELGRKAIHYVKKDFAVGICLSSKYIRSILLDKVLEKTNEKIQENNLKVFSRDRR